MCPSGGIATCLRTNKPVVLFDDQIALYRRESRHRLLIPAQVSVLREALLQDSDWAELVDQMSEALRGQKVQHK